MNWRNMLILGSSKPLVMKLLRNFFNLSEFLFAGFLRFMKLSNIMDLSYFCSSTRSKDRKKLLRNKRHTYDACPTRTALLHSDIWFREIHSFTNYRFGAWGAGYPAPCWGKNECVLAVMRRVVGGLCRKWRHFCGVYEWGASGCLFFWDQFCRSYLGSGCFFFHEGASEMRLWRAASRPSCGNN